ncbi:TetR/AcrR family transcriptional regulator [Flavobacterium sp. ASW18X]|uniref:TetR/AcrR family transcriptional regulator n=1 Tax=Flavobacterium sp. ASW18X TaxID=2572595 RepID=UPI0010AE8B0E|nr:TetR/AcrR family transcriptional regulator [Flavobacterium sp. ASW18X]TKD66020.1 TetR/AcrR family transcriptional regulator [Flavobacterium sp. ASW18X]
MKANIKAAAIQLFNKEGMSNVSMKQLADNMGISAGNLKYHYNTKSDLLEALYEDMYTVTLDYILPKNTYLTLFHLEDMMGKFDALQQEYAFFFNDLVNIIKTHPTIAKRYEAGNIERFKAARKLLDYYIETGRMKATHGLVDFDQVIYAIWMLSTFWQSQKIAINNPNYKVNQTSSISLLWQLIIPHLTEKGIEEYQQMRQFVTLPNH